MSNERIITLTLQALMGNPKLSVQKCAVIYNVLYNTMMEQKAGRISRVGLAGKRRKLTDWEEDSIIQYIIDIDLALCFLSNEVWLYLMDRLQVGSINH